MRQFVFFDHFGPPTVQRIKPGAINWMTVGRSIVHTSASDTPVVPVGASKVRVLIGAAFGQISPVMIFSKTVYLDIRLAAGERLDLPLLANALAIYLVAGDLDLNGEAVAARTLAVLTPGVLTQTCADAQARCMVLAATSSAGTASSGGISCPAARSALPKPAIIR